MRLTTTGRTLGATIDEVELRHLTDDEWKGLYQAFLEHAVLVFPAQHLSEDEQRSFAERFGILEEVSTEEDKGYLGYREIANRDENGDTISDPSSHQMLLLLGNQGWHTDSSFRTVSSRASMLSAHVVPLKGGETEWADMRAAFEALPERQRERIERLSAYHSYIQSQGRIGHIVSETIQAQVSHPILRPLVKVHPETGRPSLFIGRHAYGIPGLSEQESEEFLSSLLQSACEEPRVFTHDWTVGDIAVWDNRCVLHRGRPWDMAELRVMRHSRIAGDPLTEGAA